jgi:uncharacterized protein YqcC (DUF446 family)
MMDITRNQFFFAGLVLLALGIQLRMVESFELTPDLTQLLAEQSGHPLASVNAGTAAVSPSQKPIATKTVRPPQWLGWALVSIGATLIMHSMAMKRPE